MRLLRRFRRPARRGALGAITLAAIACLVAAPALVAQGPSSPAAANSVATREAAAETEPKLIAGARTSLVLVNTREVVFDVVLENPGKTAIPAGKVELRLDSARVDAGTGLGDATAPQAGSGTFIGEAAIGETAAGEQQRVTITVPVTELPLSPVSAAGVYRVGAAMYPSPGSNDTIAPAARVTGSTTIVWRGPGGSADTVQLSTVLPIMLPAEVRTMPTKAQLTSATEHWTKLLAEAKNERATLAIDPRVIAGIRAFGDDAPENSRTFLGELETYPYSSFLLQFADADPAAQASLGFKQLLAPETLDFASRNGTFSPVEPGSGGNGSGAGSGGAGSGATPGQGGGSTPKSGSEEASKPAATEAPTGSGSNSDPKTGSGTASGDSPQLPSLESLLDWPAGTSASWPAEGEVNAATLALLKRSKAGTVLLDSGNVRASGGPRATVDGEPAVILDRVIRESARDAVSGATEADRNAGEARVVAELALAAQGRKPGVVLGLDRGATAENGTAASEFLARIGELSWVKRTAVADQPSGTATLVAAEPLEERRELLRSAASREAGIVELKQLLQHPEYLVGYQRARLLGLFGTRWAAPDSGFADTASTYRSRDAELLRGVQAISTEHTQLVGVSARVPVQVRNSLPFDAVVDVEAVPASAALSVDEGRFTGIVVPAGSNVRVLVPVQSRVSSGESGLVISITAEGGKPTVFTGTLEISISTVVETVGLIIVLSLAVLLLGFGIWRSIRRKRRSAEEDAADTEDAPVANASATNASATNASAVNASAANASAANASAANSSEPTATAAAPDADANPADTPRAEASSSPTE